MRVLLGLMILYGAVRLAGGGRCYDEGIYVCLSVPKDYPSNITSLLLIKTAKEITTSLFTSPNLQSVKRLNLALNGIENVHAGAFRIFEKLTSFVLHGNHLKTISPDWFHESVPLEALNVANNSIDEIGPEMLAGLSSLQTLDFSSNRISKIRGGSFSDLAKLFFLDLSSNSLSYLPNDLLKPLENASFKLGNNPWNCSCPHKDFAVFLQELRNSSRLMDPEKVVCHSPPTLNGTSVWNITFDNCSSTNTENQHGVAQPIIGTVLLVILAMIFFPLLLFLIWKKKQEKKQVQPKEDGIDSRISSDTGRWTVMGAKISLKGVLFNKEHSKGHSRTCKVLKMGRSKSASAILLKSDFFQSNTSQLNLQSNTRLHHGKDEKQQACQKQHFTDKTVSFILGNIDSHNMDLCYYNNLDTYQGKSSSAAGSPVMTAETTQDICPDFYPWHDSSHRWATAILSTEAQLNLPLPDSNLDSLGPLVYLSVDTKTKEPVAIGSTIQVVAQKNNPLKLRPLRRTYTWPKERVQSDQDTNSSYELFLKTLHISPKPSSRTDKNSQSNMDQNQNCGPQAGCSRHFDAFNILSEQAELKEESRLDNISSQVGNPSKEKKGESKNQGGVCQPVSLTRRAYQSSSPYSSRQKRHVASSETASQREELNSRDSVERNNQRMTPDDDTLLENNEYSFIDLLHEVVENHGRWTRDRWRQNHQQRLPHRSSPMSLKE